MDCFPVGENSPSLFSVEVLPLGRDYCSVPALAALTIASLA